MSCTAGSARRKSLLLVFRAKKQAFRSTIQFQLPGEPLAGAPPPVWPARAGLYPAPAVSRLNSSEVIDEEYTDMNTTKPYVHPQ